VLQVMDARAADNNALGGHLEKGPLQSRRAAAKPALGYQRAPAGLQNLSIIRHWGYGSGREPLPRRKAVAAYSDQYDERKPCSQSHTGRQEVTAAATS
ncbi:MAG TPA: hypothetical protein VNY29_11815, partial [Terriglobales bacterium]|nr:hypothetical protein [Terriglobales bacterium]